MDVSDNSHDATPGGTKKTVKRLNQAIDKPTTDAGKRLVEYFVVVSSIERQKKKKKIGDDGNPQDDNDNNAGGNNNNANDMSFSEWRTESTSYDEEDEFADHHFRPTITARYPEQDHPDNPLHENLTFFCYPSGGIQLRTEQFMPKVHYFVATGGTGRQMYGTCLMLWEPYTLKMRKKKPGELGSSRRRRRRQADGVNGLADDDGDDDDDNDSDVVEEDRQVYRPKCLVLLSTWPYLIAFREFLTQLNHLSKTGEMTLPVERYIANFCSEIPAPPPGAFEVQTVISDSVIKMWSPPHNLPIAWVSLPFSYLFECLDIDNVILVWHCLVLERQVLLTSTQHSILTIASEIFLSLLFPFRWSHAYIPVLPHFLIPILSAPMPFLCGINKANLADALFDLSRECVLVDLDKNLVTLGPDTAALPPLPKFQESALRQQLEDNVGMVFREARSLTKNDDYSDSGAHLPIHVKLMAEAMWESKLCLLDEAFHLYFTPEEARKNLLNGNDASGMDLSDRDVPHLSSLAAADNKRDVRKQSPWDAVQESFLDTAVYLLRNYRKYLVFPSKDNEGSYGGAGFRSKEFIESQRFDMRELLQQLIGTQMFDNFITKRLYGSGEADVAFFDRAVDRFLKNAGMFADVDLGGRLMDAAGSLKSAADKRGVVLPGGPGGGGQGGVGGGGGLGGSGGGGLGGLPMNNAMMGGSGGGAAGGGAGGSGKPRTGKSRAGAGGRPPSSSSSSSAAGQDPLLQSARVHRKIKTIVPPEPTGDGLPPHPILVDASGAGAGAGASLSQAVDVADIGDEASVQSTSTAGTQSNKGITSPGGGTTVSTTAATPSSSYRAAAAEIMTKKKKLRTYTYATFPSEFNSELFGTPRPLPAAVIAEFDRQRKDAAQFRRKSRRSPDKNNSKKGGGLRGRRRLLSGGRNQHITRAHSTVDPSAAPPSPEVATFTVFFMAFTATVGKELVDLAAAQQQNVAPGYGGGSAAASTAVTNERTILSTYYVPTSSAALTDDESDVDEETDSELDATAVTDSSTTVTTAATNEEIKTEGEEGGEGEETHDQTEADKADVAEMKTARPSMGGMFDDDDDDDDDDVVDEPTSARGGDGGGGSEAANGDPAEQTKSQPGNDAGYITPDEDVDFAKQQQATATAQPKKMVAKAGDGVKSQRKQKQSQQQQQQQQQPRERFRNKLSDFEIEEAKATGRAQLGLAFEMLTTMKRRGLKADPEAYQCLIDACGRVGDTKRATELLAKMHEDGIVADGTVYACLVSAFSADSAWRGSQRDREQKEELPEWANSTAVEMDWNKLQKRTLLDRLVDKIVDVDDDDDEAAAGDEAEGGADGNVGAYRKLRNRIRAARRNRNNSDGVTKGLHGSGSASAGVGTAAGGGGGGTTGTAGKKDDENSDFVTETVERQIALGENLLEIVFPDISIDTENEVCPRCNADLSDDEVVSGWTAADPNDYTTMCPNCTKRFVPHFCVQCSSDAFCGSRGPASPLTCERLSPWVLQKEIRSVLMCSDSASSSSSSAEAAGFSGTENLLSPEWRQREYKNAVLWWNLVLSCMRYRLPFSFLLQGSFEQQLIAPMPEDEA